MDKEKKSNSLLMWISVALAIVILGLLVYIAYTKGYLPFNQGNKNETTTGNTSSSEEDLTENYDGTTISAVIPKGWSIKEYYNGDGSDYLVEGTKYTGLTGLQIKDTDGNDLFHISAVNGIGYEGCTEYYEFSDDNAAYKAQMQSLADEIGDTMNVNDLTKVQYTEFSWLGTPTRRIGLYIYMDQTANDNYFEASCFRALVNLNGLKFKDTDGNEYSGYFYGFSNRISNDNLLKVDGILGSMKIK